MRISKRLLPLAFLPLALLGTAACSTSGNLSAPSSSGSPAQTSTGAADPVDFTTMAARVNVKSAPVRSEPTESAKTVTTMNQMTDLGSKTTMLVTDVKGEWVKVDLPIRPNGSSGWIKKSDVELRTNTTTINVDRANHKLVVSKGGQTVVQTDIAIGSKENPTPKGTFYVTDLVDTGNAGGSYGPFALGLSGHSETLSEFAGGDGQLGIHGTNDPSSIGQSVSHGCVRVPNDVIKQLKDIVPLGTPVTVS